MEVEDEDGVVGLGETPHGDLAAAVERLGERLVGCATDDLNGSEQRCISRAGYSTWTDAASDRRAFGGIEIALWDLRARRAGRPLVDLLGGRMCDTVAFTEYFALRHGAEETPADVVRYCARMLEQHEAATFEGKLGVLDVDTELAMVAEIQRAVGPGRLVRLDANGAYTVGTARRVAYRLAELGIPWLEDPCRTLDELARLREDGVAVSFSTHVPDLARAARSGVPDGFCLDASELGGIRRTQDFLRACAAIGTDFWCYSGDAGIMTAVYLHLTAAEPSMIRPHQSLFRFTREVVIAEGRYEPRGGVLRVPDGPGLGVTLDRTALARMHEDYRSRGSTNTGLPDPAYGDGFRQQ